MLDRKNEERTTMYKREREETNNVCEREERPCARERDNPLTSSTTSDSQKTPPHHNKSVAMRKNKLYFSLQVMPSALPTGQKATALLKAVYFSVSCVCMGIGQYPQVDSCWI